MIPTGRRFLLAVSMVLACHMAAARANAPANRYTVGSGTVLDTKTNLTWQRPTSTGTFTWANAKSYCPTVGTGWRLPTIGELQTLVDYAKGNSPTIDPIFTDVQAWSYWSSTGKAGTTFTAWTVTFANGLTTIDDVEAMNYVRCVR